MKQAQQTKQLLRQLGTAPILAEDAAARQARRTKVVAGLTERMGDEAKGRALHDAQRRRYWAWSWAAAAVLIVGGGLWALQPEAPAQRSAAETARAHVSAVAGDVSVARAGELSRPATQTALPLTAADVVETGPAGVARIVLLSGAVVEVMPASEARLSAVDGAADGRRARVELVSGRVELVVPKLGPDQTLAVQTPHALVQVRGTRFSVEVSRAADGGELRTEVVVSEGVVVVSAAGRETRLERGARWTSALAGLAAGSADSDPQLDDGADGANEGPDAAEPGQTAADGREPKPAVASTLAEENRLYGKALAARRRGDDGRMIGHLDELIRRYPRSTLLPAARIERQRATERLAAADGRSGRRPR